MNTLKAFQGPQQKNYNLPLQQQQQQQCQVQPLPPQQLVCVQFVIFPLFERELALLVALQGESIWKGGGKDQTSIK